MNTNWKYIKTKNIFKNKYVSIRGDIFITPENKELEFYVVEGSPIVATLVINKKNEILFVNQFRPQIKKVVTGLPGGAINSSEKPIEAAKRELLEETGYIADKITLLHEFYFDPGRSDKKVTIFLCNNPIKKTNVVDEEIDKYTWKSIKKSTKEILAQEILDPVAQIAILIAIIKKAI